MNLIIDIGNSAAKCVLMEGNRLIAHKTLAHRLEGIQTLTAQRPRRAMLSCVVPLSPDARRRLALLPCPLSEMRPNTPVPIANSYRSPQTLGMDRMAAAVGAWAQWPDEALLVVDAGTCMTLDVVADGTFQGGRIAPGLQMRLVAMHRMTGRLPLVPPDGELPLLGNDTATALRSGALLGMRAEIADLRQRLEQSYGTVRLVLTGGDAERLAATFDTATPEVDAWLVAKGLNRILEHNEK